MVTLCFPLSGKYDTLPLDMKHPIKYGLTISIIMLALAGCLLFSGHGAESNTSAEKMQQVSDHFNGEQYFNPGYQQSLPGQQPKRSGWIWRWIFRNDWPEWPEVKGSLPGPLPVERVPVGTLRITPVGHATFLIQIDELNILTDPIWSDRCSPVSWAGPRRHKEPGIRFEDLPPIDAVLVSHNHYDHLDLVTLRRLAERGTRRSLVTLGNFRLVQGVGIPIIEELDWWQSVQLSPNVSVTLVPAQHFSSRTPWDRNKTLWGSFVISGPSGNVFFAGDTGYGPHFQEIAHRFSPIKVAILPISPFRPQQSNEPPHEHRPGVHMGPAEAVQAHIDLRAHVSIASHFQIFQIGSDGFYDAVNELAFTLKERNLKPDVFIAPDPGLAQEFTTHSF